MMPLEDFLVTDVEEEKEYVAGSFLTLTEAYKKAKALNAVGGRAKIYKRTVVLFDLPEHIQQLEKRKAAIENELMELR